MILNWNGKKYLEQFLPSVLASAYSNFQVIIADNGSTDNSLDFLRDNHPQVRIIELDRNHGFTRGYNLALKQVTADYYILLNSDVEVEPGWIGPMVALLENDEAIAACQPKLRAFYDKKMFEYAGAAGGWIDRYGYPFSRGRIFEVLETDEGQYDWPEPIFWASGAALFIRPGVFHAMQGFDEYFFAHMEEIDLCWRIQLSGKQIWSCPFSVVYHVGGGTLPRGNPRKTFLNFRNNHIMLWKNLPFGRRWKVLPVRVLFDWATAVRSLLSGRFGDFFAVIRAHVAVLGWLVGGRRQSAFPADKKGILRGVFEGNVAWQHFVKKKNRFSEILPESH